MNQKYDKATFRGLPLTDEQDAEVNHYINRQKRLDAPVDATEINAMIADMLDPPTLEEDAFVALATNTCGDAERAWLSVDDIGDITSAQEEKRAVMEVEAMKRGC